MDIITTGWLSAFPYFQAIIGRAALAASWFSDKTGNRKIVVWPCLLLAAVTFYLSYLTGAHHFWLSFALLSLAGMAMYAPYGPFRSPHHGNARQADPADRRVQHCADQ